jgi:hypothetical protein
MKTYNAVETIKKVSHLFESKQKFAFTTYTRSAILSCIGEVKGDKKPPKAFTKLILDGLQKQDNNFIKAIQNDLVFASAQKLKASEIALKDVYDPGFLEHYINSNYDVFKTFISWYVKNTKTVVVSFQQESFINKYFSTDSTYIQVPYNDFYSKVDSITEQIINSSVGSELCILDCPMLSAALAPKLWDNSQMSIFDLGRTLNAAKALVKHNDSKK